MSVYRKQAEQSEPDRKPGRWRQWWNAHDVGMFWLTFWVLFLGGCSTFFYLARAEPRAHTEKNHRQCPCTCEVRP